MNAEKYNAIVPDNVSKLIIARGLKQGAVAERAGFSKQQFSDMLNGRKIIKLCDVIAIAAALSVGVDDLFSSDHKDG